MNPRPPAAPCVPPGTRRIQYKQYKKTHTPGSLKNPRAYESFVCHALFRTILMPIFD